MFKNADFPFCSSTENYHIGREEYRTWFFRRKETRSILWKNSKRYVSTICSVRELYRFLFNLPVRVSFVPEKEFFKIISRNVIRDRITLMLEKWLPKPHVGEHRSYSIMRYPAERYFALTSHPSNHVSTHLLLTSYITITLPFFRYGHLHRVVHPPFPGIRAEI